MVRSRNRFTQIEFMLNMKGVPLICKSEIITAHQLLISKTDEGPDIDLKYNNEMCVMTLKIHQRQ